MRQTTLLAITAVALLGMVVASFATAPKLMSYQGRATDASGKSVTDGPHTAVFAMYNHPTAGSKLWEETAPVTTSGGLFTHTLGSVIPILESQFRYYEVLYLQVTFDGEVQTPRTQFTSVGYAFHVQSIHNAEGGNIKNYIAIYDPYTDTEIAGLTADGAGSSQLWLKGGDVDQSYRDVKLDAATGHLQFIDRTAGYDTATYGVRSIKLSDNALGIDATGIDMKGELYISGTTSVTINSNMTGNGSVYLPDEAIGKREIVDEPGVSQGLASGSVFLSSFDFQDIATTTITIPTSGYIMLIGKSIMYYASNSWWYLQIDEASGGGLGTVDGSSCIRSDHLGGYAPGNCYRMYYKSSGTYTFRLEAIGGGIRAEAGAIAAVFFPTSYGTVATFVTSSESEQFEQAVQINDQYGSRALVDLWELELRAAKAEAEVERARADAERAQRQLLEAKIRSGEVAPKE